MAEAALKVVIARGRPPQRRRYRHRLSPDHPRRGAARACLSEGGEADPRRDRAAHQPPDPRLGEDGIAVITIPDIRWQRCDIKSVALIPNVLGKQQAREAGAYEAWQVDRDGQVTEGTSTNAWIVTADGTVVTRAADTAILNGVTRLAIFDIIRREGYRLVERPFTVAEAKAAREAFLTSTTADLLPVVRIDGAPVGEGRPGPLGQKLRATYVALAAAA